MKTADFTMYYLRDYALKSSTSGFDLAVYAYLRIMTCNTLCKEQYISPVCMSYMMCGDDKLTKKIDESLKNNPIVRQVKGAYYIHTDTFKSTQGYIVLPWEYIQDIVQNGGRCKYIMLKLLVVIAGNYRRDLKNGAGYPFVSDKAQNYYAIAAGISNLKSLQQYLTKLEDMHILYIFRSSKAHINNLTGLYKNRQDIIHQASLMGLYLKEKKSASNTKRSLMQKYNQICKGREYDRQTIAEVRDYILQYNAEQLQLQEQFPDDDYLTNIKPTEPLDKLLV